MTAALAAAALVGAWGCGASSALVVRTGATELDCPEPEVTSTLLTHDVYEVVGCGRTAVVRCPSRDACEVVPSGTAAPVPRVVEDRPEAP
ncbi:MAG: hypothetical protein KF901_14100 [Myxococcales bacterium]|nr:hypothetical protein [Myxococcales bacterium]